MRKNSGILLIFCVLFSLQLAAAETLPDYSLEYSPERKAAEDLQSAIVSASASGKFILLEFGGDWCRWCHILDDFIHKDATVHTAFYDTFELVKINVSQENKNEEFVSRYPKIKGYPHFIILDSKGHFLAEQNTGKLESGDGYSKKRMLQFINDWAAKRKL